MCEETTLGCPTSSASKFDLNSKMSSSKRPKTIDPDKVDPSVYYYDEVYDDMKEEQESERSRNRNQSSARDRHQGSKYIDGLKETAELRKTEKELRKFRKYTRDREEAEAEGDVSREDVYISDSYKRKLVEIKQLEAEKLRRHERDKEKTMNFMKYPRTEKSNSISNSRRHKSDQKKSSPADDRQRSPTPETVRADPEAEGSTKSVPKKGPRTIEERRQYLREVLKKRTVGKVYDEAVQRYMQRKALSQR